MIIDFSWMDGVIGFVAGLIVMATVIIIGCAIGRDKGECDKRNV